MRSAVRNRIAGAVAAAALLLAAAPQAAIGPGDRDTVARVESYLQGIRTMTSKFIQTAPNGGQASGTIYLQRPGKLRVQYDPPVSDLMVATGRLLIYYDSEVDQTTHLPLETSPAAFLTRADVSLSGDIQVTDVERRGEALLVSVIDRGSPEKGRIRMTFSTEPLQLREWTVLDAQGKTTHVALVDPQFGASIPERLFLFEKPAAGDDSGVSSFR